MFFQPFPVVAQAELASALRRNGVRVELVVERLPGRVWKLQRLLDRVVFQKIHYLLTADGEVTPELIELTGGPDTEDIQAYDQIAAELALEDAFATGDVVPGEKPKIYRYSCPGGHRWAIDLEA